MEDDEIFPEFFNWSAMDEETFLKKFIEAYRANDQESMVALVKSEKYVAYKATILFAKKTVGLIAEGKDQRENIDICLEIASVFSEEFQTQHLLALISPYKKYNKGTSKIWRIGNNLKKEGNILFQQGKVLDAVNKWLEALEVFNELNDTNGKMEIINNIANAYDSIGQYSDAINYYKQCMEIKNKIGDLYGVYDQLVTIGMNYRTIGQRDKGLTYDIQALELCRKMGNTSLEARSLLSIAASYESEGLWLEALNYHKQLQQLSHNTGDIEREARSCYNIGRTYRRLQQDDKALDYYVQAVALSRKSGNPSLGFSSLKTIGNIYNKLAKYDKALDYYKQSLNIFRNNIKYFDKWDEKFIWKDVDNPGSLSLYYIANIYKTIGLYDKALEYYQQSNLNVGNNFLRASNNLAICSLYHSIGQSEKALEYCEQSLEFFQENVGTGGEGVIGEAECQRIIGSIYHGLKQYEKALEYYEKSYETYGRLLHTHGQAFSLLSIGYYFYDLRKYSDAIEYLKESLKFFIIYKDLENRWRAYRGLGLSSWKLGKSNEAVTYYQQAIDTIEEIYALSSGLKEEERSSVIGQKSFVYQEFIELLLELHKKNPKKGYDKHAFIISEKAKSRVFQELMAQAGARTAFAGDETFKRLTEKERQLIAEVNNYRKNLTKELSKPEKQRDKEGVTSLKEQLSKAEKLLSGLEKEIEEKYPRYADLKKPKALTVEELQKTLKSDETMIAYSVGKEKTVAFVIGKKSFKLIEINAGKKELSGLIKKFRKGIDNVYEIKNLEKFKPKTAYRLYQKIFEPVSSKLKGKSKIYISADDILYTLPFEALVDREIDVQAFRDARKKGRKGKGDYLGEYGTLHYLIDSYTINYLPSASVLRSLRKYKKPGYGKWDKSLIAFADPVFSGEEKKKESEGIKGKEIKSKGVSKETKLTFEILTRSTGSEKLKRLKESGQEAKAIAKAVKGKKKDIYLREKATEENIFSADLKRARYLLFSTHGLLGGDFSGVAEPSLALTLIDNPPGKDGFLSMSEVLGLDLNAEMIILSACNTYGKGEKTGSGEGFAGLARSFMYAGSKALLVTHWSVESQAARDLMVKTFKQMKKESRPDALRNAKLDMKRSSRPLNENSKIKLSLSHPFFWAPFVLVGEGR
ncbi:MAG: CHAT domain-containing protein [Deltaproteobacteria bacterium]|nr:CHAT domain-containing protein [Deltaproteobacteria bacterium]